jgi:hypothetical protein
VVLKCSAVKMSACYRMSRRDLSVNRVDLKGLENVNWK